MYDKTNRGTVYVKWRVLELTPFAKHHSQMPRIATAGIVPLQTALKWTADCQAPRSGCQVRQSALKCVLKIVAIRATRDAGIATIRSTPLSVKLSKRLNSSSHFTSRVPLFEVHIFLPRVFLE
jgi:hypothetical protein